MLPARNIILTMDDESLCALCRLSFTRGTGPGGQKRNKTSSAVKLDLPELGISVRDCTERSQFRNRRNALHKLRMEIALKIRQLPADAPENMICSLSSPGYPLFAAQLLDIFAESNCFHHEAAEKCGVSPSSLLKKFFRDPQLWQKVQQMRLDAGLEKFNAPK